MMGRDETLPCKAHMVAYHARLGKHPGRREKTGSHPKDPNPRSKWHRAVPGETWQGSRKAPTCTWLCCPPLPTARASLQKPGQALQDWFNPGPQIRGED